MTTLTSNPVLRSTRAELLRLRKWPAVWVLAVVWLLLNLTFAYIFNYVAYATDSLGNQAEQEIDSNILRLSHMWSNRVIITSLLWCKVKSIVSLIIFFDTLARQ